MSFLAHYYLYAMKHFLAEVEFPMVKSCEKLWIALYLYAKSFLSHSISRLLKQREVECRCIHATLTIFIFQYQNSTTALYNLPKTTENIIQPFSSFSLLHPHLSVLFLS